MDVIDTSLRYNIDANSPAAIALRELQKLDEVLGRAALKADHRCFIIRAEDALGRELGLVCTGVPEVPGGGPFYDHSGDTCPIHEWLVGSDHEEVPGAAEGR